MAKIKLSSISTNAPKKLDKDKVKAATREILEELDELQNLLYAQHKYSVLLIVQGMDASGKDGVIKNVTGTLNPQGVTVYSFKAPTKDESDHDFLWRVHKQAPAKGMIQVFNRSHYEDILIQRVHKWIDDKTAAKRMNAINDFEKLLAVHNNTQIIKCYLHVSHEAQQQRLVERTEDPRKMWKYNEQDIEESKLWDKYMDAYEDAINNCNYIPWLIVPADQNWYKEYLVALTLRDTLKALNMKYPRLKK
ncbi:polyphosphate:nucleotide phosphotransferase, PPK2 family [Chitinophaga terrae (ex Kim and Jung 2007)]|uniref:Polyphosphate:nucleotide phosphotransferase, PPK2 family n=1 Tax=Chitinophaga terrae (ex Kim and Jung 2007) TaxID=408074 RepID=A0A1H4CNT5_9BACT|nr:PPK2 family polyphosphate kinase [Chitinophaga terrae (ex Kim and Jung 2007)]GEP90339.1 polyphosphate kinase [Chitinophaga terrae (ex Kim and Jung 2007)]SEA61742.1 polyphosphate:nucleotide phosphotransferase, PPK2 family [Chitinophaga terrae (ex Kim and Jung 2007)]